jgi:SAM-dependent methyltransferase
VSSTVTPPAVRADQPESAQSWFHRRATLYVEAQILFHLNQVGVLELLSRGGWHRASEVAATLALEPGPTDALLDYVYQVDDLLERDDDGRYSLSAFGQEVVGRFSDGKETGPGSINMFDVRVGAYGPVWRQLSGILTGESRYGQDIHRDGRYAESGVSKLAMRFWDALTEHIDDLNVGSVLEIGLSSGLLERVGERHPAYRLYGLDKKQSAIDLNAKSAAALGVETIHWLHADFFDAPQWAGSVAADGRGLIFSLHFHELMAGGPERFVAAVRDLRQALPNWSLVAFEQPLLSREDRAEIPDTLWLYAQSNVLIHHLIGNGRILSREAWTDLGRQAGCKNVEDKSCNYLGYRAFLFEF